MPVSAAERERAAKRPPGIGSIPVCLDHEPLKALILAIEAYDAPSDDQRATCWLATARPWPERKARQGECLCGSTITIRDVPPIIVEVA